MKYERYIPWALVAILCVASIVLALLLSSANEKVRNLEDTLEVCRLTLEAAESPEMEPIPGVAARNCDPEVTQPMPEQEGSNT